MRGIYLITGSNQGDRFATLASAKKHLSDQVGTVLAESAIYETAPWGNTQQGAYLNQVLHVSSEMAPTDMLEACLRIEKLHGRVRRKQWEARTLDIDILFYGEEVVIEEGLIIPHPHLHERRFVLVPLHELAPDHIHPVLNLSVYKLLNLCNDVLPVNKYVPQ